MSAGTSALEVAEQLRRASERLERKARRAARAAENFASGAAGERAVAAALAPLERAGWIACHDLSSPGGGNIDHIVVGPPGVIVLDAKNWNGEVALCEGMLQVNGTRRPRALNGLEHQVAVVREALGDVAPVAEVSGLVVLAGEEQKSFPMTYVGGLGVVGLDGLMPEITSRGERSLSGRQVDAVAHHLEARLARCPGVPGSDSAPNEGVDRARPKSFFGATFDSIFRTWYLHSWRKAGLHRLYLKAATGEELGWKDLTTGAVAVSCEDSDGALAEAVLNAATPSGVHLGGADLPRIPVELLGSRLVGRVSRVYVGLLLGQEWRRGANWRLYGRLVDRVEGHFELGFVDLKTGALHPSVDGKLNRTLGTAERYLERLRDGFVN